MKTLVFSDIHGSAFYAEKMDMIIRIGNFDKIYLTEMNGIV